MPMPKRSVHAVQILMVDPGCFEGRHFNKGWLLLNLIPLDRRFCGGGKNWFVADTPTAEFSGRRGRILRQGGRGHRLKILDVKPTVTIGKLGEIGGGIEIHCFRPTRALLRLT
jgi:hypothetical protein